MRGFSTIETASRDAPHAFPFDRGPCGPRLETRQKGCNEGMQGRLFFFSERHACDSLFSLSLSLSLSLWLIY